MTDWLAIRGDSSVIDFRLPGDPPEIPAAVLRARTTEYYRQLQRDMHMRALKAASQGEIPPKV